MFGIKNANDLILEFNQDRDIIIESNKVIIIFLECNFNGRALELTPGNYLDSWLEERGFKDNINSIIIPDGLQVTVYSNTTLGGIEDEFITYNSDVKCNLHSISEIIVKNI